MALEGRARQASGRSCKMQYLQESLEYLAYQKEAKKKKQRHETIFTLLHMYIRETYLVQSEIWNS